MPTRVWQFGTAMTDTPGDIRTGVAQTTAAGNYMTFEHPMGTDVQVTAGKTLHISLITSYVSAASSQISIGYGDTGVGNGAVAPTNPVIVVPNLMFLIAADTRNLPLCIPIPAEKFPFLLQVVSAGNCAILFGGIEV